MSRLIKGWANTIRDPLSPFDQVPGSSKCSYEGLCDSESCRFHEARRIMLDNPELYKEEEGKKVNAPIVVYVVTRTSLTRRGMLTNCPHCGSALFWQKKQED